MINTRNKKKFKFIINLNYKFNINDLFKVDDIKKIKSKHKCHYGLDYITADPFIVNYHSKYYIFYESAINNKGSIYVSKIHYKNNLKLIKNKKILDLSYHLSYPYIFNINDIYYMIPEHSSTNTIDIYKFESFPYKLKFYKTLIHNIIAVDTDIIYHNEIYYLFTFVKNINSEMIFYTNDINTDWIKHNYEKKSPEGSRHAGHIFTYNNNLYKPKQRNILYYGEKCEIWLIKKLNICEYEEELINTINGIHHISFINDIMVTDSTIINN